MQLRAHPSAESTIGVNLNIVVQYKEREIQKKLTHTTH